MRHLAFYLAFVVSYLQNAATLAETLHSSQADIHPSLTPLSWLFGTWHSVEAVVELIPTVEKFNYKEILEIVPTEQNVLDYRSNTWKDYPLNPIKQHSERGFLQVDTESNKVAMLLAHFFGLAEISEGTYGNQELTVESRSLALPSFYTSAIPTKIVRKLKREGDYLYFTAFMETSKHKFQKHLEVKYSKEETP